jgi:hypothetical protein
MLREIGTLILVSAAASAADLDLARRRPDAQTRWSSFENPRGLKGAGGRENRGAKGHAFDSLKAHETKTLLNVQGAGAVRRMWLTIRDRSPEMLRALRLEAFWDGAAQPAVSVPLGDFFGAILGRAVAFENELFADPEGRSFVCHIPMPFRTAARITLTNESAADVPELFYDIDCLLTEKPDEEALYFHACWRRERWTEVGRDFEILPRVRGEGRFLGAHLGVIAHPDNTGWWGEGEVKMYLDGDRTLPTIVGTGAEDYIGTGWGEGTFSHRYSGSLVADSERGQFAFYRYHVPDPVYFHKDLRVTIQSLGGDTKARVLEMMLRGVPVKPVSIAEPGKFTKLLEGTPQELAATPAPPDAWVNVYRKDDWSAVALFYLDAPVNGLPRLAPVEKRVEGLKGAKP